MPKRKITPRIEEPECNTLRMSANGFYRHNRVIRHTSSGIVICLYYIILIIQKFTFFHLMYYQQFYISKLVIQNHVKMGADNWIKA